LASVSAELIDWPKVPNVELVTYACTSSSKNEHKARSGRALAEIKRRGPAGIRALMDQMHINNIYIRVHADNIIRRDKNPAFAPVLLPYLQSEHERTRKYAAYLLGYYELPEHRDQLLPLLEHEKTEGPAIRSLGKWKVSSAVPKILPYLKHEKEVLRILAANALRDIADPNTAEALIEALGDPVFTVRMTAARALTALGPEAQTTILAAMTPATNSTRRLLIQVLGDRGDDNVIDILELELTSDDPQVVAETANALRRLGATNEVETLWFSVDETSK
jgi:HEAT repeat protein